MLELKGTPEIIEEKLIEDDAGIIVDDAEVLSDLHSHISHSFRDAKDARETNDVNKMMLDSLRANNGEYSKDELAQIGTGSTIWMNVTSLKVRAASSWIQDILVGTKAYSLEPTPIPDLPKEEAEMVAALVEEQFSLAKKGREEAQKGQGQPAQTGNQKIESIKEINDYKRDFKEAILAELNEESKMSFEPISRAVDDSLIEGKWDQALLEFIDDFCIFPTAIMKGPVITNQNKVAWVNGEPVVTEEYLLKNKRINPLDIYPAPEASSPNDGDFCEHIRLSRSELSSLRTAKGYDAEAIEEILEQGLGMMGVDDNIEQELAEEELKGTRELANQSIYHGIHYFGSVPVKKLEGWGLSLSGEPEDCVEIEAIVVGTRVIKCILNSDPLGRRPYFIASFQNRPGGFWGNSLPHLLRDIQKICNGAARALADNMALSSGPQAEVNVDRLASDGPIDEMYPRKIWEVINDPNGGNTKAINFFTVPSNAKELLAVYDRFEQMADDVTMIPKYAYSNESTKGSHQTFNGLAMLLEGASKGVKGCIRRIDYGVIIPRVEYEFYTIMLKGELEYTGDINVHALGSGALTMKASEELKRQEFLRIITAPAVMDAVGKEGIIALVKNVAEGLGLNENIVPTRFELKMRDEKAAENAKAAQEAEMQRVMGPVERQASAQEGMHQGTQETARMKIQAETGVEQAKLSLKEQAEILRNQSNMNRDQTTLQKAQMDNSTERDKTSKSVALSLQTSGGPNQDKSNI